MVIPVEFTEIISHPKYGSYGVLEDVDDACAKGTIFFVPRERKTWIQSDWKSTLFILGVSFGMWIIAAFFADWMFHLDLMKIYAGPWVGWLPEIETFFLILIGILFGYFVLHHIFYDPTRNERVFDSADGKGFHHDDQGIIFGPPGFAYQFRFNWFNRHLWMFVPWTNIKAIFKEVHKWTIKTVFVDLQFNDRNPVGLLINHENHAGFKEDADGNLLYHAIEWYWGKNATKE